MTHFIHNAHTVPLEFDALDPVGDAPSTSAGIYELPAIAGASLGVWEMLPGVMENADEDEIFVVLSGAATVEFESGEKLEIGAGDMVQLFDGQKSVWTVRETLRKIYVCV